MIKTIINPSEDQQERYPCRGILYRHYEVLQRPNYIHVKGVFRIKIVKLSHFAIILLLLKRKIKHLSSTHL